MEHLTDVTVEELQEALDSVDEKTPAQRLIAAIAYKNGVTQSALAEWFDVERKTIYNWLTRIEERELDAAVRDGNRAGRPRKLSDGQLEKLHEILQNPPTSIGYDAPAWTTALLQEFIREEFDIGYSRPSCRRLLKEAGLRHRTSRDAAVEADPEGREDVRRGGRHSRHVWVPR